MKFHHIALFAAATAFVAGCAPKNPPSGYGEDVPPEGGITTPGTGIEQPAPDGPGGLIQRNPAGEFISKWSGRPEDIPAEAIALVVHFGFDQYSVEPGERTKIDAVASSLKGKKIIAAGYTDYHGTEDYNLGLSDKRANSVKTYLGKVGVSDTDIRAFGEQLAKQSGDKASIADDRKVVIIDTSKIK